MYDTVSVSWSVPSEEIWVLFGGLFQCSGVAPDGSPFGLPQETLLLVWLWVVLHVGQVVVSDAS